MGQSAFVTTIAPVSLAYLNLGCGRNFHEAWVNVDLESAYPAVRRYDLRRGIPFSDRSFDVVYHSHLLEHLPRDQVQRFLQECLRVLRPSGILRVVVPDLEQIAQCYLETLQKASAGAPFWDSRYAWMILELVDQMVREKPGGAMLEFLAGCSAGADREFIYRRLGDEAMRISEAKAPAKTKSVSAATRWAGIAGWLREPRMAAARLLLGRAGFEALQIGQFRRAGEVHRWMYDRYSLRLVLEECGFTEPAVCSATTSRIPEWPRFCLDAHSDGAVRKPDSLFMEAIRRS